MPYSTNLKIDLMDNGTNSTTWGTVTNTNLGTALEQAIVGKADISMSSTTVTLTYTDTNAAQNARAIYLNLSGSPGGAATLVVPAIQKPYIVKNGSDAQVTIKVTGLTGVVVPVGKTVLVYNNGTDVVTSVDHIPSLTLAAALPVASGGTGITAFGTGVATALGVNTGSAGAFVVNGGALGTPSSGTLTSATGLPISTGIDGLGTNVATALAVNVGSAGAVVVNGGALGTPSSGTLTSATGLPVSTGISGLGTNVATALAVNVGSAGAFVVNGGALGTPSGGTLTSCTGLPVSTGVSGLGTGVATALGQNVTGSGGIVLATSPTITTPTLTSPTVNTLLTVSGDSSLNGAVVINEAGADKDFRVESDTNANMLFVDASTNLVGIGTNTPAYVLDVNVASGSFRVRDATGGNDVAIRSIAGPVSLIGSVSNTPIGLTTNDTTRIHITAAGNVGIGTTGPVAPLSVAADSTGGAVAINGRAADDSSVAIFYNNLGTVSQGRIRSDSGGISVDAFGAREVSFSTNSQARARITSDGGFQFNSGYGSVATAYGCRAWINFDGTSGSIGTGRGSGNVSSVTDNGTGDYTLNFAAAMPDTNYAVVGVAKEYDSTAFTTVVFYVGKNQTYANTYSTSSVRVNAASPGSGTNTDAFAMNVAIFR